MKSGRFRRAFVPSACWMLLAAACVQAEEAKPSSCMVCHRGIEDIRDYDSKMMKQIVAIGMASGDAKGCTVCHGGDPKAMLKDDAHKPGSFRPDPGSPWANEIACGECHADHVGTQWSSLMMTESGKIQGVSWAFGSLQGYEHRWGNYDAKNPAVTSARQGTSVYHEYMQRLAETEPGAFPDAQTTLPAAPTDLTQIAKEPHLAAWTYARTECQRCHLGVKGRSARGDYRGMGCSACHMPYSSAGRYEGGDKQIPRDEPGHILVHNMQGSRKSKVTVHDKTYSGIPIATCASCHNHSKRIGASYQGLMESGGSAPYGEDGREQPDLHGKHYIAMHADIHAAKGMVCQDCHTSIDVHGDGFLCGTDLAQIQIECTDCHGTPDAYPWELPIGYGDEFGDVPQSGEPRGVAMTLLQRDAQGTVHDAKEGHLLTARGNPFPEVVRDGDTVIVYTAGGKDLTLRPLKLIVSEGDLSTAGRVGMVAVGLHMRTMECYSCHARWAPQAYGLAAKVDYSGDKKSLDWTAAGHLRKQGKYAHAPDEKGFPSQASGAVSEQRSSMRWEDPALAVNGENRVAPTVPGLLPSVTIVGADGKTILLNHVFRTKAGLEGSGDEGQLAVGHTPAQPHTMHKASRSCESCHISAKTLGHGVDGGTLTRPLNQPVTVDLSTPDGQTLPKQARPQIAAIPAPASDWSRFVAEDGRQLMTVGHHWPRSRPLNDAERKNMDRRGVCLACHQEIPTESPAVSLLHHIAAATGQLPRTPEAHHGLVHKTLLFAAWGQAAGIVGAPIFGGIAVVVGWWWWRRRKRLSNA